VLGGPEKYESGKEWQVKAIVAERVKGGTKHYLILWDNYDHTFMTWEPADFILDKKLVAKFDLNITGIRHELWLFR